MSEPQEIKYEKINKIPDYTKEKSIFETFVEHHTPQINEIIKTFININKNMYKKDDPNLSTLQNLHKKNYTKLNTFLQTDLVKSLLLEKINEINSEIYRTKSRNKKIQLEMDYAPITETSSVFGTKFREAMDSFNSAVKKQENTKTLSNHKGGKKNKTKKNRKNRSYKKSVYYI
jgi:hypothetical protein